MFTYSYHATVMNQSTQNQIDYIKRRLKCSVEKALYLTLVSGITNKWRFCTVYILARAILAGYTCSNLDVRSSRYDVVIDYERHLLRVKIKGISGLSIALKDCV